MKIHTQALGGHPLSRMERYCASCYVVERVRFNERAAETVYRRIEPRKDQRARLADHHTAFAVAGSHPAG